MRFVAVSVAVHLIVLALVIGLRPDEATPTTVAVLEPPAPTETMTDVVLLDDGGGGGGGGATSPAPARHVAARVSRQPDAWHDVTIRMEAPEANAGAGAGAGTGNGNGNGNGNGIGFGNGGGVRMFEPVPAPPPVIEPPPSKARPAKLVWPIRDAEVDDDANFFIARVTVDESGDVVGARMVKTRPGAKADRAANAIWSFRYSPALDDLGVPTRSTFEQPFQIR